MAACWQLQQLHSGLEFAVKRPQGRGCDSSTMKDILLNSITKQLPPLCAVSLSSSIEVSHAKFLLCNKECLHLAAKHDNVNFRLMHMAFPHI